MKPTKTNTGQGILEWVIPAFIVIAVYAALILGRPSELGNTTAQGAYYNLLVDGFRAGQLSLIQPAPAALASLPNPYDPAANSKFRGAIFVDPGRIHDLSYYKGKLYLYFGVTPALLLFLPASLAGKYVSHQEAVFLFASLGFSAAVFLLGAVRRRYFPTASTLVVVGSVLALGFVSGVPIVASRPDVWEVPIVCGSALVMLSLCALWRALHGPGRKSLWVALASLAYGLAVGSRPSLLFGAPVVLIPVVIAWRKAQGAKMLVSAIVPMACVGLGLAVYNYARFDSATEFGQFYQLAGDLQQRSHFGFENLSARAVDYFTSYSGWTADARLVARIDPPAEPSGATDYPVGILTNLPFSLLVLGIPIYWSRLSRLLALEGSAFVVGAMALFLILVSTLLLFYSACARYEMDFLPPWALLAAIGWLALEAIAVPSKQFTKIVRWSGAGLVMLSMLSSVLTCLGRQSAIDFTEGSVLFSAKRYDESVRAWERGLAVAPTVGPAWKILAHAQYRAGRFAEGRAAIERAAQADPAHAEAYYHDYASEMQSVDRTADLLTYLQGVVAVQPKSAMLRVDYGTALAEEGKLDAGLAALKEAEALDPRNLGAQLNLGTLYANTGHRAEAIDHWRRALEIDPTLTEVRNNLRILEGGP